MERLAEDSVRVPLSSSHQSAHVIAGPDSAAEPAAGLLDRKWWGLRIACGDARSTAARGEEHGLTSDTTV
jgi:hypothetical protein